MDSLLIFVFFFFSSRRRHTRLTCDWSSDVCSSDLGRSAVQTMVHRLCECETFIILDNCEHMVDACAEVAETLLKGCPSVRILATSREALGVPGEQAWLVPPLSLPAGITAAEVLSSEAGRLFLEQ